MAFLRINLGIKKIVPEPVGISYSNNKPSRIERDGYPSRRKKTYTSSTLLRNVRILSIREWLDKT